MTVLTSLREVQIPLLAAMLLGAGGTKMFRMVRTRSAGEQFGPTVLFPGHLRSPIAAALSLVELALGLGLVLTAGKIGAGAPATAFRLAACLLFVVLTCALVELRASRPEVGCGCFGYLSTAPVSLRTLARSTLLSLAGLATIGLGQIGWPRSPGAAVQLLAILSVEILAIGALSPEIGEGLIRLGYSEPCEVKDVPSQRTIAALRRSRQWRRYSPLMISDAPVDVWRELCWRFVVYPAHYEGRPADVVFAIYLQQHRPAIRAVVVDGGTGQTMPWPTAPIGRGRVRLRYATTAPAAAAGLALAPATALPAEIAVSSDV